MLKSQLSTVQSDIAKHRESLDECLKYKDFLTKLTPQEWKDQKELEKLERKQQRKSAFVEERMAEHSASMQAEIEAEERAFDEKALEVSKGRRRQRREAEEEARERERQLDQARRRITRRYPTREQVEETYLDVSSGEEMPLYFKEQKQLLEVFTTKEESNLFHIENSQETEQALEDILHRYSEMKLTKSVETNKMKASIAHLEAQIAEQRANCNELKRHINSKEGASEQDSLLAELDKEIVEVHAACGHDSEHDPDTLAMLGAIEKRLEEFLSYIVEYERRGSKEADRKSVV